MSLCRSKDGRDGCAFHPAAPSSRSPAIAAQSGSATGCLSAARPRPTAPTKSSAPGILPDRRPSSSTRSPRASRRWGRSRRCRAHARLSGRRKSLGAGVARAWPAFWIGAPGQHHARDRQADRRLSGRNRSGSRDRLTRRREIHRSLPHAPSGCLGRPATFANAKTVEFGGLPPSGLGLTLFCKCVITIFRTI